MLEADIYIYICLYLYLCLYFIVFVYVKMCMYVRMYKKDDVSRMVEMRRGPQFFWNNQKKKCAKKKEKKFGVINYIHFV